MLDLLLVANGGHKARLLFAVALNALVRRSPDISHV